MDAENQTAVAEAMAPPSSEDEEFAERPKPDPEAEEFERRGREKAHAQFRMVKDEAQAVYGVVLGQVGVRTPEEWAALLEKAGDETGSGRFLVRCLGAERYLEPATVAVLLTLRQNLIADLARATAADIMMIDAAIISYFNVLRTQRWIGNLSLVVERELFGEEPLNQVHGHAVGDRLQEQLSRLADTLLPLQERAARMMMRSLEALRSRPRAAKRRFPKAQPRIQPTVVATH
jgi:hypothetical protein